jgi:hypothetical protein
MVAVLTKYRAEEMTITGGCLCREIRYESASDPVITRVCWCRVCQYLGAGSGTVNVCFPTASFNVHGVAGDYRSIADSGKLIDNRRPLHEFSQHDHAVGFGRSVGATAA